MNFFRRSLRFILYHIPYGDLKIIKKRGVDHYSWSGLLVVVYWFWERLRDHFWLWALMFNTALHDIFGEGVSTFIACWHIKSPKCLGIWLYRIRLAQLGHP